MDAMRDAYLSRHNVNTTGWSYAIHGKLFASLLFIDGQISKAEYRRWWRFFRRLRRWERTTIARQRYHSARGGQTL